jgi:hypothetical protein
MQLHSALYEQSRAIIAQGFSQPFDAQHFMRMFREVVARDTKNLRKFEVPEHYATCIARCDLLATYRDAVGDELHVIHITIIDTQTFLQFHGRLHSFLVKHAKRWLQDDVYTIWVIYDAPGIGQWRMQIVTGTKPPVLRGGVYTSVPKVTRIRAHRLESTDSESVAAAVAYYANCAHTQRPTVEHLSAGVTTMTKQPIEIIQALTTQMHTAVDDQYRRLAYLEQTKGFADRVVINDQQRAFVEAVHQWEIAVEQLMTVLDEHESLFADENTVTIQKIEDRLGVEVGVHDAWQHTKPRRFRFEGREFQVREWQQVYREVLQQLYIRHGEAFVTAMNSARQSSKPFFAREGSIYKSTRSIAVTEAWYYETWLGAQSINANIRRAFDVMGVNPASLVVWIQKKH